MNAFPLLAGEVGPPATDWDAPGVMALKLLAVVLLVVVNGFFVASEFAIVKVRSSQLDALVARGNKRAGRARHVTDHLDAYLSATQFGITLASLGLGWIGEPFLARLIEPFFALVNFTSPVIIHGVSFALAFALITILHIVAGELAPKSLAIRRPVPTALLVSGPLRWFHTFFRPIIAALNSLSNSMLKRLFHLNPVSGSELSHSEEELRFILEESARTHQISGASQDIAANAFDMRRRRVRDVMTPRGEVVFLDTKRTFRDNLERAKAARHTRFPLCEGHLDRAIGLVHIKDLLAQLDQPEPSLLAICRELLAVPETMPLEKLLALFRDKRAHLAVVVDEHGGSVGIATLQQAIAEVVGDMPDEFGLARQEFRRINEGEFLVDGGLGLHEMRELADVAWEDPEVSTIGGYVTHQLGRLPQLGEQFDLDGFRVIVEQADARRIKQLRFERQPRATDERGGAP
ncbi:MAG TPA: hemolysin family protein [Chthoniobacterales bacterium]